MHTAKTFFQSSFLFRIITVTVLSGELFSVPFAQANDTTTNSDGSSTVHKIEHAIDHGVKVGSEHVDHGMKFVTNGIEHGAKAAEHGVARGVQATAHGVETVTHKVGLASTPNESQGKPAQ